MDGLEDYDESAVTLIEEDKFSINKAIKIHAILLSIAAVLGVCSNVYVVWLLNTARCRSVTNLYIINRSLADLMFLLTVPVIVTQVIEQKWLFGTFMCKISVATTHSCGLASCFFLAALSINCYFSVTGAVDNNTLTKWFKIFTIGIWLCASIYAIPYLIFYGVLDFGTETHCTVVSHSQSLISYLFATNIISIVIPMVISGLMVTIICVPSVYRIADSDLSSETQSAKNLLVVLTITFSLGHLPYVLSRLVHFLTPFYSESMMKAIFLITPLPFIVAALNPLIYIRFKGDLLKAQPNEVFYPEPTVALISSEPDTVFIQ